MRIRTHEGAQAARNILFAACLMSGAGCSIADLHTPERLERGLVVILPGIEGRGRLNLNLARGLDEGGVRLGIEIFDWTTQVPGGALINLTAYERNRRVAGQLGVRLLRYRRKHPGRPVHLVGHSGGGAMAVLAAERLPRDVEITCIILLAPAIDPLHDLSRALRRSRYGIFNYYSERDIAFLKLGTSLFGTLDRTHGPSAGAVGFRRPPDLSLEEKDLYAKLHQVRWRPVMRRYGHDGGHTGWTCPLFVRHYLGPLITDLSAHRRPSAATELWHKHLACEFHRLETGVTALPAGARIPSQAGARILSRTPLQQESFPVGDKGPRKDSRPSERSVQ